MGFDDFVIAVIGPSPSPVPGSTAGPGAGLVPLAGRHFPSPDFDNRQGEQALSTAASQTGEGAVRPGAPVRASLICSRYVDHWDDRHTASGGPGGRDAGLDRLAWFN